MKKPLTLGCLMLLIIAAGWMIWISILNTRMTATRLLINHSVEEVAVYQISHLDEPLIRIETNGEDTERTIELRTTETYNPFFQARPAKYIFTVRVGSLTARGRVFCCETGIHPVNGTLTINGLSEWSFSEWAREGN